MRLIYQILTTLVRIASNALAAPVWYGIFSAIAGLFGGGLWDGFKSGWTAGWTWATTDTLGMIVTALFGILGLIHGIRLAQAESYFGAGFFALIWDHLWSLPNTILGSVFALITLGIGIDQSHSHGTGRLVLDNGIFADFDTTIGNVTAGHIVDDHEGMHVWQARIFGPFLYPIWIVNYVINTVLPWWLFLTSPGPADFGKYFVCGVYPYTLFEIWAYAVQGSKPSCT